MINAAIDMDEQVYLQSVDSEAYGHIPTHGRAESYSHSIFSFLEEPPHRFPQWLQKFTRSQLAPKGSCFPTAPRAFALVFFLMTAILTRVRGDEWVHGSRRGTRRGWGGVTEKGRHKREQ